MTQYNWTGDGDGTSWSDPKNWQTGDQVAQSAPGSGDDVTFGITAPSIMDAGSAENITVYSGLDVVGGDVTTSQVFYVDGGAVSISDAGQISVSNQSGATAYLNVDGSIDVSGSGSELIGSGSGGAIIGGVGSLTIEAGAGASFDTSASTGSSLSIGEGAGANGNVLVEGSGSILEAAGVDVGVDGGTGSLTIAAGASALFTALNSAGSSLTIGVGAASSGNVIVEGIGSELTATGVIVGDAGGSGVLLIQAGGAANFSNPDDTYPGLAIGYQGSVGSVTVAGSGSSLTVTDSSTWVGGGSLLNANFVITGGATASFSSSDVTVDPLIVGVGTLGNVSVDGSGSSLTAAGGTTFVGSAGDVGIMTISNSAIVKLSTPDPDYSALIIGNSGIIGSNVTVEDHGSLMTSGGAITVGYNGAGGFLDVDSGGLVSTTGSDPSADSSLIVGDNANGTVIVNGFGSGILTTNDNALIGYNGGTGSLTVQNVGVASFTTAAPSIDALIMGDGAGSTGTVLVDASALTTSGGGVAVGDNGGTGNLTIQDGAIATFTSDPSVDALDIGSNGAGGTGMVTVTGSGSTLTASGGAVVVGDTAAGSITVSAGATLDANDATYSLDIGDGAGGSGKVDVSGSGSTLSAVGPIIVGDAGVGSLTIENSASLMSSVTAGPSIDLGNQSTGAGTMTVTGSGTNLVLDQGEGIFVGDAGFGLFDVENGATVNIASADPADYWAVVLGYNTTGGGTLVVNGPGSTFTAGAGGVSVGDDGFGSVTVSAGGTLDVTDTTSGLDIGTAGGATGMANATGSGSTLDVDGPVIVGDGGTGTLTIAAGATAKFSDGATLGQQSTANGKMIVTGADTSLDAGDGDISIGVAGTGEIDVTAGGGVSNVGTITIGDQGGSNGTLLVDGDGSSVDPADMTVGGQGTGIVTLSTGGSLAVTNLTIGAEDGGNGTVTIADADSSLDVSGALTVGDGGVGLLTDDGDLSVAGAITVGAQSGGSGTLTFNGTTFTSDQALTIGDSGNGLVIVQQGATASFDSIVIGNSNGGVGELDVDDATVTSNDITVGSSGGGTLKLTDSATLNTNADATVGAYVSGNVQTATVDSQSIWAVNGDLTIGDSGVATSTIGGEGQIGVTGAVVLGGQSAASGTLTVTGENNGVASNLAYGGTLTVGSKGDGFLNIDAGAYVSPVKNGSGQIDIAADAGSKGMVTVDGAGSLLSGTDLWVGGAQSGPSGTGAISLSNGGEVSVSNITVWGGSSIEGAGTVNGAVKDDGTVTASGGALEITGAVGGTGVLAIDAGASLQLDGAVAGGVTVDFDPAVSETLVVNDLTANASGSPQNFNATIENFQAGDVIAFAASGLGGAPAITDATPGAFDSGANTTSVVLADGGGAIATLLFEGDYSGSTFTVTASGDNFDLTAPPCYCAGTHTLTDKGEITVENLAIGDVVITARGERRPIVWLGHRKVDIAKYYSPESVRPIRVKAGALGDKVPSRDLRLSPDHALFIDGLLIQAGALVNGTSIVRETTFPREFVYYHIELDDHSLILAENTPAETFVDNVDRLGFDNWAEHEALYPGGKPVEELPYPRAKGRRQVPMHIRAAIDARAIAICLEEISAVA